MLCCCINTSNSPCELRHQYMKWLFVFFGYLMWSVQIKHSLWWTSADSFRSNHLRWARECPFVSTAQHMRTAGNDYFPRRLICLLNSWVVAWFVKCENTDECFQKLKSSNVSCCPPPKDIQCHRGGEKHTDHI